MYVCICNAIRETDLRAAARVHPFENHAPEVLYQRLGRTPQCRQCLDDAAEIISEERSQLLACGA